MYANFGVGFYRDNFDVAISISEGMIASYTWKPVFYIMISIIFFLVLNFKDLNKSFV